MFKILLLIIFMAGADGKVRAPVQLTNHQIFIFSEECEADRPRQEDLIRKMFRNQLVKSLQSICTEYSDPGRKGV